MSEKKSFPEQMIENHGSLEQAIEWTKSQLGREPLVYRLNLQVLLNIVGREAESFAVSDELMSIAPQDDRILFNRGWHLLYRNKFTEGFSLLEHGRSFGSYGDQRPMSSQPLYCDPEQGGDYIMLVLEGGLGDQIFQARFATTLHEKSRARVILACDPQLVNVFSRLKGVSSVITRASVMECYHDRWLSGMSAPLRLLKDFSEIPGEAYLRPLELATKNWSQLIGRLAQGKKKVGIRWAGSPLFEHQQLRKFPAEILTSLADLEGVQLFSFQRDHDLVELPSRVTDLGPFLKTWEDTAAALSEMDLIISSCTSVAHMSAALGQPTWVVVPVLPYFVWAHRGEKSSWYNSVKVIRQTEFGQWDDVKDQLRSALKVQLHQ